MENKTYIIAAVLALAIFGSYFFPKNETVTVTQVGASSAGSTFSTAKVGEIVGFAPATDSATTTSILNTDANDRVVSSYFASCNTVGTSLTYLTGTGLATLQFTFSTSTVATGYGSAKTNGGNLLVATSTADSFTASSTSPFPNPVARIWPTGTYLIVNSNATNTAVCAVGVHYYAL